MKPLDAPNESKSAMQFVGRKAEIDQLCTSLAQALSGKSQVRFITGSAGTGKSSLIEAFSQHVQAKHPDLVVVSGQCNAHTGASDPYLPFLTVLEQLTSGNQEETGQSQAQSERSSRLKSLARISAETLMEHAPQLIGTLIPGSSVIIGALKFAAKQAGWTDKLARIEEAGKSPDAASQGAIDQEKIIQQYSAVLSSLARRHPLIIVLDDLHWIDNASCNLLFQLSVRVKSEPLLLIGMYRPNDVALGRNGERHPLETVINELKRYHGEIVIDLDGAKEAERRAFVSALLDLEPNRLGPEFRDAFFQATGGQALFCVELLQDLRERRDLVRDEQGCWTAGSTLDWNVLPARVEGVIGERIGRLESDLREILTMASIEGESFTVQVLAGLQKREERALLKMLSGELEKRHNLVTESSTERVGRNWLSRYLFSHVLFQQYLYKELSQRERMILHGEVAGLLEELYKGQTEKISLHLARHFRLAGEETRAIDYLLQATRRALRVCAYTEGQSQMEQALEMLSELPDDELRRQSELEVLVALSTCLKATRGWDSPEVITVYNRAREICKRLGAPTPHLAPVIFGLWAIRLLHLDLAQARTLAEECLDLARSLGNPSIEIQARVSLANTCFWAGDFSAAARHLEGVSDLSNAQERQAALVEYGQDPLVFVHMFGALLGSLEGQAQKAIAIQTEMLHIAEEISHPFSLAIALQGAAWLQYHLRIAVEAGTFAGHLIELASERQFPFYRGIGLLFRGWARAVQGDAGGEEDVDEGYLRGIAAFGGKLVHSLYCLMKAECQRRHGSLPQALETVASGLHVALTQGELAYLAELHRMKAELLAAINGQDLSAAEAGFAEALAAARSQDALLFELRASTSLGRLLLRRGAAAEARSLILAVVGKLNKAEGGIDWEEAQALLAEL
jgi:hypothetical protein